VQTKQIPGFFYAPPTLNRTDAHGGRPLRVYQEITMLVLTRKNGELISIGDGIQIKVISVSNNRVKIGIEAPREVPVRRGELDPVELAVFQPGARTDTQPANPLAIAAQTTDK